MANRIADLWFKTAHLTDPDIIEVVEACKELADLMDDKLKEGPEKMVGMRCILNAKDAFARAVLEGRENPS